MQAACSKLPTRMCSVFACPAKVIHVQHKGPNQHRDTTRTTSCNQLNNQPDTCTPALSMPRSMSCHIINCTHRCRLNTQQPQQHSKHNTGTPLTVHCRQLVLLLSITQGAQPTGAHHHQKTLAVGHMRRIEPHSTMHSRRTTQPCSSPFTGGLHLVA